MKVLRIARMVLLAIGGILIWPPLWTFLCLIGGFVSAVAGVYMLAGTGWAMIAAAAGMICLAAIIARGVRRG